MVIVLVNGMKDLYLEMICLNYNTYKIIKNESIYIYTNGKNGTVAQRSS